jgi:hypothetical protein
VGTGGTGTTVRQSNGTAMILADNIVTSTGSYTAGGTCSNGPWAAGIFTFFQGSGGGGGTYHVNRFRKFII